MKTIFKEVSIYILSTMLVSFLLHGLEGGHAHAPFSLFPEYLIIAPLMPILSIISENYIMFFQYIIVYLFVAITVFFVRKTSLKKEEIK